MHDGISHLFTFLPLVCPLSISMHHKSRSERFRERKGGRQRERDREKERERASKDRACWLNSPGQLHQKSCFMYAAPGAEPGPPPLPRLSGRLYSRIVAYHTPNVITALGDRRTFICVCVCVKVSVFV